MSRTHTVYKGCIRGKIVYIGTTIQKPADRFIWHKHNGKNLEFTVLHQYDNAEEMLEKEFELIKTYNPKMNKIKHRKQNLNKKLTEYDLELRVGDKNWCQSCLRRRVNVGYKKCAWC